MIQRTKIQILIFFIMILLISDQSLWSQSDSKMAIDEDPVFLFGLDYGFDIPGGDLAENFGLNLEVGTKFSYMLKNNNIHFGLKASYIFGDTVKQDVLANLRDENGFIIGVNGTYAQVKLRQRAYEVGAFISKIFPVSKKNLRSGIRIDLGLNYLRHWIRLQDDYNTIAQFDEPYNEGYDRLTSGFAINEFIGYHYMSKNRKLNFYGGFDLVQGFTTGKREYDYATQSTWTDQRMELLYGIKVGLILPIFMEARPEDIFY